MIYEQQQMITMRMHSHAKGFTLVELMIVIAILGVLAGIAYPAFDDYMKKSRRSDGTSLLMQISAKQEQFFLDNRRYTSDFTELGYPTAANVASEKGYYTITIEGFTNYTYTLRATPVGSQTSDKCTSFTIDHNGTKDDTNDGTIASCW